MLPLLLPGLGGKKSGKEHCISTMGHKGPNEFDHSPPQKDWDENHYNGGQKS